MILGAIYIVLAFFVTKMYKKWIIAAKNRMRYDSSGNKMIDNMCESFIEAAKDINIENINTPAIIGKEMSGKAGGYEMFLLYIPGLMVLLGLFGTFLGLTIALSNFNIIVESVSDADMDMLIESLKGPLASMATAFITSLMGIFFSVTVNLANKLPLFAYSLFRQKFHAEMENVLDNHILANYKSKPPDINASLGSMTAGIKEALEKISAEIVGSFQSGFDKFNRLEEVSIKINDTGAILKESMENMNKGSTQLNVSIGKFESLLSAFNEVADTRIVGIQDAIGQMSGTFSQCTESMESFSHETRIFNDRINEVAGGLRESYNYVVQVLEDRENFNRGTQKTMNELGMVSERIAREVESMSQMFARRMGQTFEQEIMKVAKDISTIMNGSLNDVSMRNRELESIVDQLKERIAALQKNIINAEVRANEN
jgi:uncharacterized protein YukE